MAPQSPAGSDNREAVSVLDRFFDAEMRYIAAGGASRGADFSEMAALLHPDAVMHQGPSVPWPGDWRGIKQLELFFSILSDTWSAMDIVPVERFQRDDGVAIKVVGKLTSRATGWTIDADASHFIELKDGLIHDWTVFFLDPLKVREVCGLPTHEAPRCAIDTP